MATDAAVFTQQPQDDRHRRVNRLEGFDPIGKVIAARRWILLQPVVIGRKVEFADAAGNRGALLDRHQPFVLTQMGARLAGLREKLSARRIDLGQEPAQRILIDLRIAF